jgi:hypothetical protein
LDRYLQRDEKDMASFYGFVCENGKVPVITGNIQATWPLDEHYCPTMLILHFPNWRTISDWKKSYKQVNQVLGITAHHPLEK